MDPMRWALIQENFDRAVSHHDPRAFVASIRDLDVRDEVASLLEAHLTAADFLENPTTGSAESAMTLGTLQLGECLGPWRIVRLIGHGGMGEVYEAARADGQFEQRAALKVSRREAAKVMERFNTERQILARLDHPGIARILDGGLTPDGRPYAVMEYVEGDTLLKHCESVNADLRMRLSLFMQLCRAVAHAHRNLIVHRDIKPNNVLVDRHGRVRLLDFGIAKPIGTDLMSGASSDTAALLTPDYAAPEQLTGEPITTATDIYALGLLLFELLVGRRPWSSTAHSLAGMVRQVLDSPAPTASAVARLIDHPPIAPRLLAGDLDAIIARCLSREPEQRYSTVMGLLQDVDRSLRGDPIAARSGTRLYVLGRMLQRYRWVVVAVLGIITALSFGIATTTWQARRAEREAARAVATRDFLIDVFRASDPRLARDHAPGEITAKELLDGSVDKIETQFAHDPETQLQLLGLVSEIYGLWLDEPRFQDLLATRIRIAREHFGATHPVVIEGIVLDAWASIYTQDYAQAKQLLAQADRLILEGGHEDSLVRAGWWLAQAEALKNDDAAARSHALDRAVALYERLAPSDSGYAIALANSAVAHLVNEEFEIARSRNEAAIRAFASAKDRSDGDLAMTYANYARSLQALGEITKAEAAYEHAKSLVRKSAGVRHGTYWRLAADHARLVHLRGERDRAHEMFAALLAVIPSDWETTIDDVVAHEYYADRLLAEGRAAEALPLLKAAEQTYIERPMREFDVRRIRQTLGDAYDRLGRIEDARRTLAAAREERMRKDRPDSIAVLSSRERWARFLLDRGELEAARIELDEIVRIGAARASYPLALAHGDRARLAQAHGAGALALQESRTALALIEKVTGLYDIRILPQLWDIHADALALNGDTQGADEFRARAVAAARRYNGTAR